MTYSDLDPDVQRVRYEVRRFRQHLITYLAVMAVLFLVNAATGGFWYGHWWFFLDRPHLGRDPRIGRGAPVRRPYRRRVGGPDGSAGGWPPPRTAAPRSGEAIYSTAAAARLACRLDYL